MKCLLRYLNQPTNLEEVLSIEVLNDDPAVRDMIERFVSFISLYWGFLPTGYNSRLAITKNFGMEAV